MALGKPFALRYSARERWRVKSHLNCCFCQPRAAGLPPALPGRRHSTAAFARAPDRLPYCQAAVGTRPPDAARGTHWLIGRGLETWARPGWPDTPDTRPQQFLRCRVSRVLAFSVVMSPQVLLSPHLTYRSRGHGGFPEQQDRTLGNVILTMGDSSA